MRDGREVPPPSPADHLLDQRSTYAPMGVVGVDRDLFHMRIAVDHRGDDVLPGELRRLADRTAATLPPARSRRLMTSGRRRQCDTSGR